MIISDANEKIELYNTILANKNEAYVLFKNSNESFPLYIKRNNSSDCGFYELHCKLFQYSFTKGDIHQEKFMKEQGYVIIEDIAYDIQTPIVFFDFSDHFGDFKELTKDECVKWLIKNGDSYEK